MILLIGLIIGAGIGYKLNDLVKKINNGIHIKILGYNLYIGRESFKPSNVVKIDKKEKVAAKPKVDDDKCETCNDEDMYIKGTKNLIACPGCKRNADKFKKITI